MTQQNLAHAAQEELVQRELARNSLIAFTERFTPDYQAGWVHKLIASNLEQLLERMLSGSPERLMLFLPPRTGKLIAHDEEVWSNKGLIQHGDLEVGDQVFTPQGLPCTVVAVSGEAPADWVVTFSDGSQVRCHGAHEWTVYNRRSHKWATVETSWLAKQQLYIGELGKRGSRYCFQLPLQEDCIQFSEKKYELHPYILGVWLGDGTHCKPTICFDPRKRQHIDKISALGLRPSCEYPHSDNPKYANVWYANYKGACLTAPLKKLGVWKNKHVPEEYLCGSVEQRLQLLAGLIDTDGCVDAKSRVVFSNTNKALIDSYFRLCQSLNLRPYKIKTEAPRVSSSGIQGKKPVYKIGFQPPDFLLDKYGGIPTVVKPIKRYAKQRRISITSVKYEPSGKKGKCIQVDSPDGLYLVTAQQLATHNSHLSTQMFPAWALGHNPDLEFIVASYSSALSLNFSRTTRNTVQSSEYKVLFPQTVIDPNSKSVENWYTTKGGRYFPTSSFSSTTGHGANCVLPYCKVCTEDGIVAIQDVRVGDRILGYDHFRKQPVWTTVRAVSASISRERLVFFGSIGATASHKFFDRSEKRYKPLESGSIVSKSSNLAFDLVGQMPNLWEDKTTEARIYKKSNRNATEKHILFSCMRDESSQKVRALDLSYLWRKEGRSRFGVFEVCTNKIVRKAHYLYVQSLCKEVHNAEIRSEKETGKGRNSLLLLKKVLRFLSKRTQTTIKGNRYLQKLWSSCKKSFLQSEMLPTVSFQKQESFGVFRDVFAFQGNDCSAAREKMCFVREKQHQETHTPYRPRLNKQQPEQFDTSVPELSWALSQVHGRSARDLESLFPARDSGTFVVDIQTGTGNFFLYEEETASYLLAKNCLILDDLVADSEQAQSESQLQKLYEWLTSTALTRLMPRKNSVILIMTRWSDLDPAGRLLSHQEEMEKQLKEEYDHAQNDAFRAYLKKELDSLDRWRVLSFPAIAEQNEYITPDLDLRHHPEPGFIHVRSPGQALHPERFDEATILRIKRSLPPRQWNALYQQNPIPEEGSFFKKSDFRYVQVIQKPEFPVLQAWDFAIGTKQDNDWTVGVTGFLDYNGVLHIIDLVRIKEGTYGIVQTMVDQIRKHKPYTVGMERGHISQAILPVLEKELTEQRLYPSINADLTPMTDKMVRARPLQGMMQRGVVSIDPNQPWFQLVEGELTRFPYGKHDDIVDALSWLARLANDTAVPGKPKDFRRKSWRDKLRSHMVASTKGVGHLSA